MKKKAISIPFFSLMLTALSTFYPAAQADTGGATSTPGTDQHLTEQGLAEAKTHGYSDCGRAVEADLHLPASGKTYAPSESIAALIGTPAPEFADDLKWVNCLPLTMAKLRGHPVFIRFWGASSNGTKSSVRLEILASTTFIDSARRVNLRAIAMIGTHL